MKKFILYLSIISVFFCSLCFGASAQLVVTDTYQDVVSTSSQATNLLNAAMNYKSFAESDYVIFSDVQYSYYIVWGDLVYDGLTVASRSDVELIHYNRSSGVGSYSYSYTYSTEDFFSLRPSHFCTSNIPDFGFAQTPYQQYKFYYDFSIFLVFLGSVLFVILISHLRKGSV